MEYRPLDAISNEIRVITILTEGDDPEHRTGPIHCRLEHVSIDQRFLSEAYVAGRPTIGESKIWSFEMMEEIAFEPRPHPDAATNVLWHGKYNKISASQGRSPQGSNIEGVGSSTLRSAKSSALSHFNELDDNLPWRYCWGDYVALSYVWGDPQATEEIFLNDASIYVTHNLEAALRQLRSCHRIRQGFKVWVDAICINQSDIVERNEQVSRMRDVYASAWHVVVSLGIGADDSDLAMTAVKYLSLRSHHPQPLQDFYRQSRTTDFRPLFIIWSTFQSPMRKAVYRALYHFFNRPYWQRLWILQEIANGRSDTPVLCGEKSVKWQEIYDAASFIQLDEHRFGRDVKASAMPRSIAAFSWHFTSDRLHPMDSSDTSSERLWKLPMSIMVLQQAQHSPGTAGPISAFQCLHLSRDAQVTDQRDKVNGILGLSSIAKLVNIKPDYTLSVARTFYSFSRALCASGDLSYLRLVQCPIGEIDKVYDFVHETTAAFMKYPLLVRERSAVVTACMCGFPSWVVCWKCPHSRTASLLGRYAAAGQTRAVATFSLRGDILNARAVVFDTIGSLSAFHSLESDRTYPFNGQIVRSIYGDIQDTKRAFWRTIIGDTTRDGVWALYDSSCLLDARLWEGGIAGVNSGFLGLHDFMSRNKSLNILGYTLKHLIKKRILPRRLYNPTPLEIDAASWAMNVLAWRRLITTNRGYMGLAPAATAPQDKVCILLGCNVPLVLRPHGETYEIIGECYIHGIMKGEAMQLIDEGIAHIEEISIC